MLLSTFCLCSFVFFVQSPQSVTVSGLDTSLPTLPYTQLKPHIDHISNNLNLHHSNGTATEKSRFLSKPGAKSAFMTGFGLGFLAFAIKKMLLPVILGVQIIKSIIIAMFLPSILGSIGKLLGKGLKSVSSSGFPLSMSGNGLNFAADPTSQSTDSDLKEFHFDDFNSIGQQNGDFNYAETSTLKTVPVSNSEHDIQDQISRFGPAADATNLHYYYQQLMTSNKIPDYKSLHRIPESSALLTDYDPFYSPILSRLDAIFKQMRLEPTEQCREKIVCKMYANPVKYAPYSNLVSAQLSRELYELRKPVSDSPEILRFFKYLKAAKIGQDDDTCHDYERVCESLNEPLPALITTYNDINKLVQARKLL